MTIDSTERRQSTASQVVSEFARRGSTDTRRSSVKSEQAAAAAVAAAAAAAAAASSAAAAAAAAAAALAGLFQQEQSPVENGKEEEEGEECPEVQELCLEKEEEVAEELCPLHAEEFEEEHEVVDENEKFDEQGAAEEEIVEKAAEEEIVEKAAEEEIVEKAAEEVVVNEVVKEEQQPEPVGCSGKTKHTVHFRGPCWSQVLESSIEQLEEAFKEDVFEATGIEAKRLENLNFNCANVLVVTFVVHYTAEDVHANEVHAKLRQYKFPRTTGLYPSKK